MIEIENVTNGRKSSKQKSQVPNVRNRKSSNLKSQVTNGRDSRKSSTQISRQVTNGRTSKKSSKKQSHEPEKNFAPFGVAIKRFASIGFHPLLDPTGSLRKRGGVGPGQYDLKFLDCAYKTRKLSKEPWKRKNDTEEFSKTLGYRLPHVLKEREERKKANGPGTLEIDEALFRQQSNNIKKNVYFGITDRWKRPKRPTANPPPGTYGKNHDPYLRWEETQRPKHQWTPLPTFEWDNFVDRFKLGRNLPPRTLPPDTYASYRQSSIQQLLAKRVSKRGPYDLFTGPRDERTIKGYWTRSSLKGVKSWPMKLPAEMDRLKQKQLEHYGKFLQCDRFTKHNGMRLMLSDLTMCPRNPDEPGPGHYEVERKRVFKQNEYAFNQSVLYVRPRKKWEILPGVGRYDQNPIKCRGKDKRESWMFKSKCTRGFYTIIVYNNF